MTVSHSDDEPDDAVWVRRVQDGDTEAFEPLVRRYQTPIYNLLLRWLDNRDDAADVAQDVFVAAFRSLGRFRGEARFSTWLYQIAINHAKNRRKALGRVSARTADTRDDAEHDPIDRIPDPGPGPSDQAERREVQRVVQEAINGLSPHDALVIILRDLQEQSYDEIAHTLAVPVGTVKSRLHRAREALAARLAPWCAKEKTRP